MVMKFIYLIYLILICCILLSGRAFIDADASLCLWILSYCFYLLLC